MATTPQTIDPEVMPVGSALPLKFQLPQGTAGFFGGIILGFLGAVALMWAVKKGKL